jgi:hypothetical protein
LGGLRKQSSRESNSGIAQGLRDRGMQGWKGQRGSGRGGLGVYGTE